MSGPATSALVLCAISVMTGSSSSATVTSRPSAHATAAVCPSGAIANSMIRPNSRCPIRLGADPSAGITSRPSSPPLSDAQATASVPGMTTGRRPRTPGSASSARAGPSRPGSQCTVPRTSAPSTRDQFAALLPERERVLGPEHPETLTTRGGFAHWTGAAGDATSSPRCRPSSSGSWARNTPIP
jgi:hypothetical protein